MGGIEVERDSARAWRIWLTGGILVGGEVLQLDQMPFCSQ